MMGSWGYGHMGGFGWFGWIGMVLVWILLALAVVWLWRTLDLSRALRGWDSGQRSHRPDGALQILRERFARGEIAEDEFESMKRQLS